MPGGQKTERDEIWRYVLRGAHNDVSGGVQMLVELCADMTRKDMAKFKRLPDEFPYAKKQRFARSSTGQKEPQEIAGSGVFLDANMNTKAKKKFAKALVRHFGFAEHDLQIDSTLRTVH